MVDVCDGELLGYSKDIIWSGLDVAWEAGVWDADLMDGWMALG